MRSIQVFAVLLFLSASAQAASFEGKWAPLELPPFAKSIVMEFTKDGNYTMTCNYKQEDKVDTMTGKWRKTGDKTIEMMKDEKDNKRGSGVMLEDDLIETSNFNATTKIKFKRMK